MYYKDHDNKFFEHRSCLFFLFFCPMNQQGVLVARPPVSSAERQQMMEEIKRRKELPVWDIPDQIQKPTSGMSITKEEYAGWVEQLIMRSFTHIGTGQFPLEDDTVLFSEVVFERKRLSRTSDYSDTQRFERYEYPTQTLDVAPDGTLGGYLYYDTFVCRTRLVKFQKHAIENYYYERTPTGVMMRTNMLRALVICIRSTMEGMSNHYIDSVAAMAPSVNAHHVDVHKIFSNRHFHTTPEACINELYSMFAIGHKPRGIFDVIQNVNQISDPSMPLTNILVPRFCLHLLFQRNDFMADHSAHNNGELIERAIYPPPYEGASVTLRTPTSTLRFFETLNVIVGPDSNFLQTNYENFKNPSPLTQMVMIGGYHRVEHNKFQMGNPDTYNSYQYGGMDIFNPSQGTWDHVTMHQLVSSCNVFDEDGCLDPFIDEMCDPSYLHSLFQKTQYRVSESKRKMDHASLTSFLL